MHSKTIERLHDIAKRRGYVRSVDTFTYELTEKGHEKHAEIHEEVKDYLPDHLTA